MAKKMNDEGEQDVHRALLGAKALLQLYHGKDSWRIGWDMARILCAFAAED